MADVGGSAAPWSHSLLAQPLSDGLSNPPGMAATLPDADAADSLQNRVMFFPDSKYPIDLNANDATTFLGVGIHEQDAGYAQGFLDGLAAANPPDPDPPIPVAVPVTYDDEGYVDLVADALDRLPQQFRFEES